VPEPVPRPLPLVPAPLPPDVPEREPAVVASSLLAPLLLEPPVPVPLRLPLVPDALPVPVPPVPVPLRVPLVPEPEPLLPVPVPLVLPDVPDDVPEDVPDVPEDVPEPPYEPLPLLVPLPLPVPVVPLVPPERPAVSLPVLLSQPTRLSPASARAADAKRVAVFRMRITLLQCGSWDVSMSFPIPFPVRRRAVRTDPGGAPSRRPGGQSRPFANPSPR